MKIDISNLEENTVYHVKVKCSKNNVEHEAIFFMGFKSGAYCVVYNNSYDAPVPISEIYSLQIINKLINLN